MCNQSHLSCIFDAWYSLQGVWEDTFACHNAIVGELIQGYNLVPLPDAHFAQQASAVAGRAMGIKNVQHLVSLLFKAVATLGQHISSALFAAIIFV